MKKRILLVEDDLTIRKLLKKYLEKFDYEIWEVENGELAVQTIKNNGMPDLIITDLMMPVMGGYELLEKINEMKKNKPIKVVGMTAGFFKSNPSLDFHEKIEKPFKLEEIRKIVEKLV